MSDKEKNKEEEEFINPIDKDKVAENPGLLPYSHNVGGAVIKPEDKGKIKGRALNAMYQQTENQMGQLQEQFELLAEQAKALQRRREVSELIYEAELSFEPRISYIYYLYQRKNNKYVVSLVGPNEWGRKIPFKAYLATVRLLADHTWDVLEDNFPKE